MISYDLFLYMHDVLPPLAGIHVHQSVIAITHTNSNFPKIVFPHVHDMYTINAPLTSLEL